MNRILKTSVLFAAVALCGISCSKWTEQQAVDFKYTTLEEKNPELYKSYLASVREFRASEHQVLIARVDNKATTPVGRAEHLNALPDSVDYVVFNNPSQISEVALAEVATLRETKAQKFLAAVSYTAIDKAYQLYVEDFENPDPEAKPMPEADFVAAAVADFVKVVADCKLDGILASYSGKNPLAMTENEVTEAKALQDAFFAPLLTAVGSDKLFFFEGNAKNIVAELPVISRAKFVIVPVESKTSALAIDNAVLNSIEGGEAANKIVAGVTALDVTDKQATDGLFSGESSAAVGAAYWAVAPSSDFKKSGVCVNHAQFDYYHIGREFCEVRKAISVMNPSPIK